MVTNTVNTVLINLLFFAQKNEATVMKEENKFLEEDKQELEHNLSVWRFWIPFKYILCTVKADNLIDLLKAIHSRLLPHIYILEGNSHCLAQ